MQSHLVASVGTALEHTEVQQDQWPWMELQVRKGTVLEKVAALQQGHMSKCLSQLSRALQSMVRILHGS
jgi:hypothetical protein